MKKEGEEQYKRKMIKRRKQFQNASKIEKLQEEHGNTMSDIRGKKNEKKRE